MQYEIREMDVGEILDQAIALLKGRFGLMLRVAFVLNIPFGLISRFTVGRMIQDRLAQMPPNPTPGDLPQIQIDLLNSLLELMPLLLGVMLVNALIVVPLTQAAMVHAIASTYLGRPIDVGAAFTRALQVYLPLVGTAILFGLLVLWGSILCIIPGLVIFFWFVLYVPVIIIEGTTGIAAFGRSKFLMKGNVLTCFVLALLVFAIKAATGTISAFIPQLHLQLAVNTFVQAVATIFESAAFVAFYFSCRCKVEHFDLMFLAESVGNELPSTAPAPPEMPDDSSRDRLGR